MATLLGLKRRGGVVALNTAKSIPSTIDMAKKVAVVADVAKYYTIGGKNGNIR
jgi:hypothetical protein